MIFGTKYFPVINFYTNSNELPIHLERSVKTAFIAYLLLTFIQNIIPKINFVIEYICQSNS